MVSSVDTAYGKAMAGAVSIQDMITDHLGLVSLYQ